MARSAQVAICLLVLSAAAFAQDSAGREERREVVGTGAGSLTAVWVGDQIVRFEDALAITEFSYEDDDDLPDATIVTVRSTNTKLSHRGTVETCSVEGLPRISQTNDDEGRVTAAVADGRAIATYAYSDGYLDKVSLTGGLSLLLSRPEGGRVRQVLELGGRRIYEVTADGYDAYDRGLPFVTGPDAAAGSSAARRPHFCKPDYVLHFLQISLGLPCEGVTGARSPSGLRVISHNGEPVLYLLGCGRGSIGFDAAGKALFYDFDIDVGKHVGEPGTCIVVDFPRQQMVNVTPDRILLTNKGETRAYVSSASRGAIMAFGDDGKGGSTFEVCGGRPTSSGQQ